MDNRKWESGASNNPPAAPAAPSSGHPTDGDPLASVPPTIPGAYWFYQLGEELRAILTAAGITPDKTNLTQLLTALRSAGVFATPAQFDNSTKVATTEFVDKAVGSFSSANAAYSASTTMPLALVGGLVLFYGNTPGQILTLPGIAQVGSGATYWIANTASVSVTIKGSGAEDITANTQSGSSTANTIVLSAGDSIAVGRSLTGWICFGITAANSFPSSKTSSGYLKFPNGIIMQWGMAITNASGVATLTLPVTIPNASVGIHANYVTTGNAAYAGVTISGSTLSSVSAYLAGLTSSPVNGAAINFVVICY